MSKEGVIFMCQSEEVPPASYVLAECKQEIVSGTHYGPDDIKELIEGDASLQSELIFWINADKWMKEGKHLMLITNPDDELVFPGYNTDE